MDLAESVEKSAIGLNDQVDGSIQIMVMEDIKDKTLTCMLGEAPRLIEPPDPPSLSEELPEEAFPPCCCCHHCSAAWQRVRCWIKGELLC